MKTAETHPMRRILISIGLLSFSFTMFATQTIHAQTMADYTAMPPFVSENVPPNVLLIMDNSGSMNESAYHPTGEAYDPAREYQGYFAPNFCYSYGSSQFKPVANKAATGDPCSSGAPWLGNFLNYFTMTKLEVTKFVMMGGKCAPRAINGTCYPGGTLRLETNESVSNIDTNGTGISPYSSNKCFRRIGDSLVVENGGCGGSSASYFLRAEIAAEPNGVIQAVGNRARFGLMQFKSAGDGAKVLAEVGGNLTSMVNAIENTDAATWTPLAESLYEAIRYFAQIQPAFNNSDYSYTVTSKDPYYFRSPDWSANAPGEYVYCCKSFVMIFTDGASTQDTNVPTVLRDFAHAHHGSHCTSADPDDPCPGAGHKTNYSDNGNHYLDDVAFYAHTTDLRQATLPVLNEAGKDLPGFENITVYTFYAFGQPIGRELLQTTAKTGGFEDTNGNNKPDLVSEYDAVNNYTGAKGADGLPDTYFESADADDLRDKLVAAINSILQRSASGTSISVLATSATGEGSVYQAYFYTSQVGKDTSNVKWVGYTHSLFVDAFGNFREDTNHDGVLSYKEDLIVRTRYDNDPASPTYRQVVADKFADTSPEDGLADSTTPTITGDLRSIEPIWEAGKELALTNWSSRNVLTWIDQNNDGLVDPPEQIAFSPSNCTVLRDYLRYAGDSCAGGSNATNLIEFTLGREVTGLRPRELQVPLGSGTYHVWKLGDPIHSTPTVVAAPRARYDLLYGDSTYTAFYEKYRTRRQVVYVGANDGMLHAFNGGFYHKGDDPTTNSVVEHGWYTKNPTDNASGANLGTELWSFIPYQLLPQLQWLARNDYTHVYYVDLKPTIAEARIFAPDADHPGGWGTILIGGFRMGGSCGSCLAGGAPPMKAMIGGVERTFYSAYFVLDITNPEVSPKLLWSFSSPNLGLTTSYPAVTRMNPMTDAITDPTNEKWHVIFGSGPNGYNADLPTPPNPAPLQGAKLFVIDLKAGPGAALANVTTMPIGTWPSFMGHVVAVDTNLDWRTDVAYAGRTIHDGALPWRGKMYRLKMGCSAVPCSPTTWGIADGGNRTPTEVIDTFFDASSGTTREIGPMASSPAVTIDDANQVWVFFGTGRYFANLDKSDNSIQGLYGIKDSVMNGACAESSTNGCHDNNLVDVTNAVVCLICSTGTNQVTDPTNPSVTSVNGTGTTSMIGLVQSKDGWRVTLPGQVTIAGVTFSAERSLVNPTLIAGTIFFPTFTPTNDLCVSDGRSYLYALFYKTGTASTTPVIGTTVSGSSTNVTTKVGLGVGLASSGTMHLGEGGTLNFQQSTGAFSQTQATLTGYYSRFVSWVHQRD
jgi:type IV pilus assembly protein PilY1